MSEDWQVNVAEKRAAREEAIPKGWRLPTSFLETFQRPLETSKNNVMNAAALSGLLTEKELKITEEYEVEGLLKALASGELTSLEVTVAFSKRAAIAQQLTGCLTEMFFEEAQERARQLDDLHKADGPVGPLHGLPVSVKDSFQLAGKPATLGLVAYLDQISEANSAMVDVLISLGAVLYVKTNIPQTMMTADSHNYVFGRVLNPWNTSLGAGGSTGGEGALVAFRGSPLGVGTDIAGSVRIPALCCGTYGFKPSSNRVPYGGQKGCSDLGYKPILASAGPLANDFDALGIFTKAVIGTRPFVHDGAVHDIPWRTVEQAPGQRLRIGLVPEDPVFPLHPPVKEALTRAVEALRKAGHEIITLSPDECQVATISEIACGLFSLDNTGSEIVASGGEPPIPSRTVIVEEIESIHWSFLESLKGLSDFKKLSALQKRRAGITDDWRKLWVKYNMDAVLAPSAQSTAVEHDMFGWPAYTGFLNVLDYPACVIPYGTAKDNGAVFTKNPGQGAPDYNPKNVEGAPCSVQIFTSRFRDEECLAVAKLVDTCLNAAKS